AFRIGKLADSNMIALPMGHIRRVCCASPGYLEAQGRPRHPSELARRQCIATGLPNERHFWSFNDQSRSMQQVIEPGLTITTAEGVIMAAECNAGIARTLSYQTTEAVAQERLEIVLEPFEPDPWPIHLVHGGQSPMPQKTRVLIDFIKPHLRARLKQRTQSRS